MRPAFLETRWITTTAVAAALLTGGRDVLAQLPHPDPFAAPSTQLVMCMQMPVPNDTSAVGFRFEERDSVITRSTGVAFRTTGKPIYSFIYVQATGRSDSANATAAKVHFLLGKGERYENRGDAIDSLLPPQKDADGQPLPRGALALTASDMERARNLMQWYWDHRCDRHAEPAKPPQGGA